MVALKYLEPALISLVTLVAGCRRDDAIDEELKWSCAHLSSGRPPVVDPECLLRLRESRSVILTRYRLVPRPSASQIEYYELVE